MIVLRAAIEPVFSLATPVLDAHALAAATAADQTLQQSRARPFHPPAVALETLAIGRQTFLVGEVLIPGKIGGVDVVEEDFPLFPREMHDARIGLVRLGLVGAVRGFAIGVGPGVGGVFEEALEPPQSGLLPQQLAPLGPTKRAMWEEELVLAQVPQKAAHRTQLGELGEDVGQALPDAFVRIEDHGAIWLVEQADGEVQLQFPPLRLVLPGREEPPPEEMQFGFGQGPLEAQEQTVVVGVGIVDSIRVGEEGVGEGTEFEEAVPVGAGSGEAGNLDPEDQTDVSQGNLGGELLEPGPQVGRHRRLALIFVDDGNLVRRPAQVLGALDQVVLEGRAFLMLLDLGQGRLADVDVSPAGQMGRLNQGTHKLFSFFGGCGEGLSTDAGALSWCAGSRATKV